MATEGTSLLHQSVDLPYLRTPLRRWAALVVITLCSSFDQIPLTAWQVLQPVMLSDNVLCGVPGDAKVTNPLDQIYNIGLGLAAVSNLFVGLMFDIIGPRAIGLCGVTCTIVGFSVMGLCLHFPCAAPSTPLLWISSLLTFIAAPCTALAAESYLYILSDSAFLVSAIANANVIVAVGYGLIIGTLNSSYGAHSYSFFYLMAGCNVLSVVGIASLIPSRADFRALQSEEMARQRAKARYEGKTPAASPSAAARQPRYSGEGDDNMGGGCGGALRHMGLQLSNACTFCFSTQALGLGGLLLVIHIFVLYMQQSIARSGSNPALTPFALPVANPVFEPSCGQASSSSSNTVIIRLYLERRLARR